MEPVRDEAVIEHARENDAPQRLTDARFRELVGNFLIEREETAGAMRAAEAYQENAREAESALTGRSENLDELHARRDEVASVAAAAREEARRARARAQEAGTSMGQIVSMLRKEGMPSGEWIRHGDLGVYLHHSPEEGLPISTHPWEWVERSPVGANPAEVERTGQLLEDLERGRSTLGRGLAVAGTGGALFVGTLVAAGPSGEVLANDSPWDAALLWALPVSFVAGLLLVLVGLTLCKVGGENADSARRNLHRLGRDVAGSCGQEDAGGGGG